MPVGSASATPVERSPKLIRWNFTPPLPTRETPTEIFAGGNGISFEFGTDDRCRVVVILPAGRLPGETYLPLYGNIEVAGATE